MREGGVAAGRLVPARDHRLQALEQAEAGLDGVDAAGGVEHVRGPSLHLQGDPGHAHLRAQDGVVEGLRDDGGVGAEAVVQAGQRAVAGALLLDHRLQEYRRGRAAAQALHGPEGGDGGGDARLHVARAATVQAVAVDARLEWRRRPELLHPHRHHVDVAVEDQRAAAALRARPVRADDVVVAVPAAHGRRIAGQMREFIGPHRDAQRLQSHALEQALQVVLCAGLLSQQAGKAHQRGEQTHQFVAGRIHGGQQFLLERGIGRVFSSRLHRRFLPSCGAAPPTPGPAACAIGSCPCPSAAGRP